VFINGLIFDFFHQLKWKQLANSMDASVYCGGEEEDEGLVDGWIDSWGLDGCCWQDGNSFEYWKGGSKTKDSGCFSKCLSTQPWMGSSEADALQ
jgi:hypothetical protein